ncbi:MAG: hypothetical protein ACXWWC_06075 [Chitinophagaceae bacterium]
MHKSYLPCLLLFLFIISCKKEKDNFVTGIVQVKGGCFSDSWLIAIENPDLEKHTFLRAANFPTGTLYNCSNAVFIRLSVAFANAGTKVRFSGITNNLGSCLSFSEAPNHIEVKEIFRL